MNFFIHALPRSRTTWLARALTDGPAVCLHDALSLCWHVADLATLANAAILGNADTGSALWIDALMRAFPDARHVVIRRDPDEVCHALAQLGLDPSPVAAIDRALDRVEAVADPLVIEFPEIDTRGAEIWRRCIGTPFDAARWNRLTHEHIETDLATLDVHPERLASLLGEL